MVHTQDTFSNDDSRYVSGQNFRTAYRNDGQLFLSKLLP